MGAPRVPISVRTICSVPSSTSVVRRVSLITSTDCLSGQLQAGDLG